MKIRTKLEVSLFINSSTFRWFYRLVKTAHLSVGENVLTNASIYLVWYET